MKKKLLIVIGLLLVIAVGIGMSYAYYMASISQVGENVIRTDCFKLDFIDNGQIVLDNTYPIKDSDANDVSPYHFKIKNVCNLPASYQVNLEVLNDSTLDIGYLNYKLNDGAITGLDNVSVESTTPTLNNASTAKIMATGNLIADEEKEYDLRVFVKEAVTTADPVENKTFKSKVVVISTLNKSIMKSIKLNANGGTLPYDTFQGYVGYKFNNLPTPTKENEDFLGWYSDSELTQKVTNETLVTSEMTDLYAKWKSGYTITFNANGGTVSPSSVNVEENQPLSLPTPTKPNAIFDGWYDDIENGNQIVDNSTWNTNKEIYAHWITPTYSVRSTGSWGVMCLANNYGKELCVSKDTWSEINGSNDMSEEINENVKNVLKQRLETTFGYEPTRCEATSYNVECYFGENASITISGNEWSQVFDSDGNDCGYLINGNGILCRN